MEAKKRILVVDDETGILCFVHASLTLAGYEVLTTASGEEALRLAQSEKPDLMLLDIVMFPLNGFQVLDRLRTFSRVPVIMFTARSFIAREALELGANGLIAKPFLSEQLLQKVQEVLGGKASAEEALS